MKVVIFVATLLLAPLALAVAVVDNLGGNGAGSASPQSTFWLAQKFTTDNTAYNQVDQLSFIGARAASQSVAISIWSHDTMNDLPAAQLGTFDTSMVLSGAVVEQTVPANGTISLAANTDYWIVFAPSDINFTLWQQVDNDADTGPGNVPNRRASSNNNGVSWSDATANPARYQTIRLGATVPVALEFFEID